MNDPNTNTPIGSTASDEHVYFKSKYFLVSSKIIRSKDRFFNPSMINSISFTRITNPRYSYFSSRITAFSILAALFGFIGLLIISYSIKQDFTNISMLMSFVILTVVVLLVGGVIKNVKARSKLEPYGWIGFDTSSGNSSELISTNLPEAEKIRDALITMIRDKNS